MSVRLLLHLLEEFSELAGEDRRRKEGLWHMNAALGNWSPRLVFARVPL